MGGGTTKANPEQLKATAAQVLHLRQNDAASILKQAKQADPDWYVWGLVGSLALPTYWDLSGKIYHHLEQMGTGLEEHAGALDAAGKAYKATDDDLVRSLKGIHGLMDSWSTRLHADDVADHAEHEGDLTGSVEGYDVIQLNPKGDIPVQSILAKFVHAADMGEHPDSDASPWNDVKDAVADLAANVIGFLDDPLNWLISSGLSFLINIFKPLQDLLGMVTGNPERMGAEIDKWSKVAEDLGHLAGNLETAAGQGLIGWVGSAADAATTRLGNFVGGIKALSAHTSNLVAVMTIVRTLMSAAQAFLIGLIAQLVEWVIITWASAIAAEAPTLGGSTAVAATATEVEAADTVSTAVRFVDRVVVVFDRIAEILGKLHKDGKIEEVVKGFRLAEKAGDKAPGVKPAAVGDAVEDYATNWSTYAGVGVSAAAGGVDTAEHATTSGGSDDQIDRDLSGR